VYEEEKNHGKKGGEDRALGNHVEKMQFFGGKSNSSQVPW
jgi:hypothetical protein